MKYLKNPVVLIMVGSIVLLAIISAIFIIRPKNGQNIDRTTEFGQTIEIGQIICPLEGDECASSEITTSLDESFPLSTLNYTQFASASSVLAVFDGEIETSVSDMGDKVIKIKNTTLNIYAEYTIKGNILVTSGSVSKGDMVATTEKPGEIEQLNNALTFRLYTLDDGENLSFEKIENKYLEVK